MKRLPLGLRLLLNILVFSIPIVVLTFLMYQSETVNIEFGLKEKLGNRMQRPYEKLLKTVSMMKLYDQYQKYGFMPVQNSFNSDFDQTYSELQKIHSEIGQDLQFTSEGLSSRKRENANLANLKSLWDEKKYDDLIVAIKTSIAHLGDTSNLILDPDLDSYYAMDITLLALPQMQDRIQSILAQKDHLLSEKPSEEARIQAALFAAMLNEADLGRVLADSQTSLNEDANFFGRSEGLQKNMPRSLDQLKAHTDRFIQLLQKVTKGEVVADHDWAMAGFELLNSSYDSWNVMVDELDYLLSARVNSLSKQRTQNLIVAGCALLFAIVFSIFVGASLSQTIQNIMQSVFKLKEASAESSRIGVMLKDRSQEVTDSVSVQASAVQETAASIHEISSIVDQNAQTTKVASELASTVRQSAQQAESEINSLLSHMNSIFVSSRKIVESVTIIDDIAFQTNLLALNASVEAARAGELGRGFAVVAEAVRALAQKSSSSAKEIHSLVQENVRTTESGQSSADRSAALLKQIVEKIQKLNSLNTEVASASNEQSHGIGQISRAMLEIEKGSQDSTQALSHISDSAQTMLNQALQLQTIVDVLEKEVLGRNNDPKLTFMDPNDGHNGTRNHTNSKAA